MPERSSSSFSPIRITERSRCWEVDNDYLLPPIDDGEWEGRLAEALTESTAVGDDGKLLCSTWGGQSITFGHNGCSVWIACAGSPDLVEAFKKAIQELIPAKSLRRSEVTHSVRWRERIRVDDGKVWIPMDDVSWLSLGAGVKTTDDPSDDNASDGLVEENFTHRQRGKEMIWANSKCATLYYSKDRADEDWACVVKLTPDEILVEYEDEGTQQYVGKNDGTGHFELHSSNGGRATLHMFPGSKILEGSWTEGEWRGMWRIELD